MYYRNAAAAIVVYDITNQVSHVGICMPHPLFQPLPLQATFSVLRDWIRELQKLGPPNIVLAIAGNKSDLSENREVKHISSIALYTTTKK